MNNLPPRAPLSAMCLQKVFLNIHRWLWVGSVLYTYWLNTFSDTWVLNRGVSYM